MVYRDGKKFSETYIHEIPNLMEKSLKIAKEQLINRWVAAFDEIEKYSQIETHTVKVKYADIFSYHLSTYRNGKISAGSKLSHLPPEDRFNYGKYGFNQDGFLTTAEIYSKGSLSNFGFFTKNDDIIEYIEFSAERRVPSSIQRIFFENDKKILFESVFANGRSGFHFKTGNSLVEKITAAFNDGHSAICTIEKYDYDSERITKAHGLSILPGIGEHFYENIYSYTGKKLTEIKTYNDTGRTSIAYVAPSGRSLKTIINELAEMFCDYLISMLKKQHFDSPLFIVELSYRYCDNYIPHPVVVTERQKNEAIAKKDADLFAEGEFIKAIVELPTALEELYVEFYQLLETKDNWEAGRKMLKQTARLLSASKLKEEIPVSADFIAFPIEWELEWEELEKILLQCGASKSTVKEWKMNGWV